MVKMSQTYRSGTGDIDAIDYTEMFLDKEQQVDAAQLNDFYVLENLRPVVTKKNCRMECGVAGYDNTVGLPSFFLSNATLLRGLHLPALGPAGNRGRRPRRPQ